MFILGMLVIRNQKQHQRLKALLFKEYSVLVSKEHHETGFI